jgi:hypothetical protein
VNGCKAALQSALVEVCHVSCQTKDAASPEATAHAGP